MIDQINLVGNLWRSHKYMNFRSQRTFVFQNEDGTEVSVPARSEVFARIALERRVLDLDKYDLVQVR